MITVKNLTKIYGKKQILNIDILELEEGKSYALVGANGSGKSTFLNIFSKLLKPGGGEITVGKDKRILHLPQINYPFNLSVKNNILFAFPALRKENISVAAETMKKLGIFALRRKNAKKLSGGETQKLCLARILVNSCDILLLDEPTSAMDIRSTLQAEEVIKNYVKENSGTLIFASHSLQQAERLSDKILFFYEGKILEITNSNNFTANQSSTEFKTFLQNY